MDFWGKRSVTANLGGASAFEISSVGAAGSPLSKMLMATQDREAAMPAPTEIKLLEDLPRDIEALRAESIKDGFRFIDKLKIEWQSAANRFDKPGEALIGAFQNERLVAVCGLNVDPYAGDDAVGRLRHLYVLKIARRQGIASAMVGHLLGIAQVSFACVRLFTDTRQAATFYEAIGFSPIASPTASHILQIK